MRIALFCSNIYETPPLDKKIVHAPLWLTHQLAEGLTKNGHKVYLFASSGSHTKASKIISGGLPCLTKNKKWALAFQKLNEKEKLIIEGRCEFTWATKWKEVLRENYELLLACEMAKMAQKRMFDIVQLHSPLRALHFAPLMNVPVFFTIHDPPDHPFGSNTVGTIASSFNKTKNVKFISISNAQRKLAPKLNWAVTIYNGTDLNEFAFSNKKGDYLAFAGRIVPQKGLEVAVKIAKKTNRRLKIAGKLGDEQKDYWNKKIKPYLSKEITYEGMLPKKQMPSFYQGAEALLMPILWHEPFGLVMTEAMACGTPVIGFDRGSVKEVIKHGESGFVVNNEKEMVRAIQKIDRIERRACRRWAEKSFSLDKMVNSYEKLYLRALNKKKNA